MFTTETVVELIDKPGSSFQWAPRIDYSDPNLRVFIEQNVVQQGLPVIVSNVSKGITPIPTIVVIFILFLGISFSWHTYFSK